MARDTLDIRVQKADALVAALRADPTLARAMQRWRADASALRFHLRHRATVKPVIVVLGGTGTGKSTVVNRLMGKEVSATSYRRTFTSGAVAAVRASTDVPAGWLGVDHKIAEQIPSAGQGEALVIAPAETELTDQIVLVDTPDVDGDQPMHHEQADRAFRWAQGVVFVVTPEKYQMTELLAYYRLARRYAVGSLFVMNKCEESAVLDDYAQQLSGRGWEEPRIFAIARDDAAYEPPIEANLSSLRQALSDPAWKQPPQTEGINHRAADLAGRLQDQIIAPLRQMRTEAQHLMQSLQRLITPEPGVDVNPVTQQLQRRLQQRSVLYLMGPQRVLDRVRQVPGLLARLPRTAWDLVIRGEKPNLDDPTLPADSRGVPDFAAILTDQFKILHSRMDDLIRSNATGQRWIDQQESTYRQALLPTEQAGAIAQEELAELKQWLEQRWNATPRDTAVLMKLIKHLPGGKKLAQWSEAAPYLLAIVVATHHAFFGHIDLMILGGWTLATWLTERLSNEVAARTRKANARIAARFAELAQRQIDRACDWIDSRVPCENDLNQLQQSAEEMQP
ncbi:MAG: GTPase domain-containing protein [Phycisphaerales bacterium]|nr:GTPase domain-containing protein [Phycisphaerales bacterium]